MMQVTQTSCGSIVGVSMVEVTCSRRISSQQCTMEEAVLNGDLGRVRKLIRNGANVNESKRMRGSSLLHLAIEEGYEDIALALLEAGADVHAKDKDGWTALHWVCCREWEDVVQALIDKGSRVNEGGKFGVTPLMAQKRANEVSLRLLRAGASCEGLEQRRVEELLCYAWNKRDLSVIRTLLRNGCRLSILSREDQERLLYHTCCEGDVFVVEALLANGCNMNCADSTGLTPLMAATEKSHEEVVKKLIMAGGNLGMQTVNGNTALHFAAICNRIQCGILLAEGGAMQCEDQEQLIPDST